MDVLIHTSDGKLVSPFDVPGTKVRRKENLGFKVKPAFPVGEIKEISSDCKRYQDDLFYDPNRPICHVLVTKLDGTVYCFHPYQDTLEVVE